MVLRLVSTVKATAAMAPMDDSEMTDDQVGTGAVGVPLLANHQAVMMTVEDHHATAAPNAEATWIHISLATALMMTVAAHHAMTVRLEMTGGHVPRGTTTAGREVAAARRVMSDANVRGRRGMFTDDRITGVASRLPRACS